MPAIKGVNTKIMTALIILLGLTSPFSTDMCLPALPTIAATYDCSYSVANLLIISFFLFMAICTLLAGPLSDRFGRKKVLLVSLVLFTVGNLGCTLTGAFPASIALLIFFRALGACGAGGMLNSSTALTKDVFSGYARDFTLHFVQAFHILGPLLAPSIGAFLLNHLAWYASFVVLALLGAIEIVLTLTQPETQPEEERGNSTIGGTFKMLGVILKNRNFTCMLIVAGGLQACFMTYLATSSYIYTVNFGVSTTAYGIFFGICGLCSLVAPVIYLKGLYPRFKSEHIYRGNQICVFVGGALILLIGILQGQGALKGLGLGAPTLFMLCWIIVALNNAIARPLATSIMLKQHEGASGSLSALINFGLYIIGLVGMILGSLAWDNYIIALGAIIVVIIAMMIVLFAVITRPYMCMVLDDEKKE